VQEAPVLRPLSVGDIIDRIIRLFRANPILLLGIAILPDLIVEVLQRASGITQTFELNDFTAAFSTSPGSATVPRAFQQVNPGLAIAVVLVSLIFSLIQAGAMFEAIGQRYLGRAITVREAYERGLRAVPRLVVSAIVVIVAFIALFLVVAIALAVLNSSAAVAIAIVLGLVGFLFVLPWAFLSLAVVGPAIVLEGLGPIAAIRRSFHLMDKARLRTLGLYVLVGIISSILGLIFGVVFLVSFVTEPTLRAVLQAAASVASAAISGPLLYGAIVVLYYDLRVRKEAFDLQLAAEALPREG
jgi:MFS family permease